MASIPRGSTSTPFLAVFQVLYAVKAVPIAAHEASVKVFSVGLTMATRVLNCEAHAGLIAASIESSALSVIRANGYEAISWVLSVRLSALIVSMSVVCTSSFAVLSGANAASLARTK